MARDLTIRLLGRPTVTEDSQLGFHKLTRKFVVQGNRACKDGIVDENNPLFLSVGTADEEFSDYYLVNQKLDTAQSMDKAYLTREYVDIRDTWNSESISEGGDLKKMVRRYVVLKTEHDRGYDATSWASHPHNSSVNENDPWDYLPKVVKDTEPVDVSYTDNSPNASLFSNASNTPSDLKTPKISLGGGVMVSLNSALSSISNAGNLSIRWLRANAQVDTSNPGVDVWSVSWAAPVTDHWVMGTGKRSSKGSNYPSLAYFDWMGLKVLSFGSGSVSGASMPTTMHSYISYVVGETAGSAWSSFFGSLGKLNPSVSMDFFFESAQYVGDGGGSGRFQRSLPNTVFMYTTSSKIVFPDAPNVDSPTDHTSDGLQDNDGIAVAYSIPMGYVFKYYEQDDDDDNWTYYDAFDDETVTSGRPHYQRRPITKAAGHLSWSHAIDRSVVHNYSQSAGSSIKPIFSHGKDRIWKITLTWTS